MDVLFGFLDDGGLAALLWIGILGAILYKGSSRWFVRKQNIDGPILSGQQLLGMGTPDVVSPLHKGEIMEYPYSFMINAQQRTMLFISLPYNTRMHIIALGSKSGVMDIGLQNEFIEKVSLEGSFPDDFSMYVTRGMQRQVRQVFDPVQMAYFTDFCKAYNFELYKDGIYISQAEDARDTEDTTSMVADAEAFLKRVDKLFKRLSTEHGSM